MWWCGLHIGIQEKDSIVNVRLIKNEKTTSS